MVGADPTDDDYRAPVSPAVPGADDQAGADKQAARASSSASALCPIVGIGASAGGLGAFRALLHALPRDTGMAFVLVQHLDPNHESLMSDLLAKATAMPVRQAEDAMAVEPNNIYIIPPNNHLRVVDHGLFLSEFQGQRGPRLPIDHFFSSLAEAHRERAIGIVLSGTGADGAQGIREVKAGGGLTLAQTPESAEFPGMPQAAIATGQVDHVLPIAGMPEALLNYARHPYLQNSGGGTAPSLALREPDDFQSIVNVLRAQTNHDFRCYKRATLERRIERRMSLHRMNDLSDYLGRLRRDSAELHALFKDLLISVTRFFRDREAWGVLEDQVITPLITAAREREEPIRIWVPGCATGEEAYSIAMLLFEQIERQRRACEVQIFGTDLDADSIAVARNGVYPISIAEDIGTTRLRRFFVEDQGRYRVNKRLRDATVFAAQNLIGDPPFSKLDLISCRNLLIYLDGEIQGKLIDLFHFALRQGGYLYLGNSESIGRAGEQFETVDKTWRIYRRLGDTRASKASFPIAPLPTPPRGNKTGTADKPLPSVQERVQQALLAHFVPATVAVSPNHEVRYFHGPVARFLDFPPGEPTVNIIDMAPDEALRGKLRALLYRAQNEGGVYESDLRITRFGQPMRLHIQVRAVAADRKGEQLLLASFTEHPAAEPQADATGATREDLAPADEVPDTQALRQLHAELQATREDLQSTIEELETANEELKASNEEVMSMNEELQSANEELETSREELQSLNEELSTVNNQLSEKVDELEATNNDLANLLVSTDIATIFLDTNFCIRRFTPAATQLLRVIEADIGRPISDLAPRVNDPGLNDDAQTVLNRLTPIEVEVKNGGERWYLRRILPYRTSENRISGVVVTYNDVTSLKHTGERLWAREQQQALVARLGRMALDEPPLDDLLNAAARGIADVLPVELVKLLRLEDGNRFRLCNGVGWNEGVVGEAVLPGGLDSQAGYTLQAGGTAVVTNNATEKRFRGVDLLRDHGVASGLSVAIGTGEAPWGVLGAHSRAARAFTVDDINLLQAVANVLWMAIQSRRTRQDIVDLNAELRLRLQEAESLYDKAPIGLALHGRDLRHVRINARLAEINGRSVEAHLGKRPSELLPDLADTVETLLRRVIETGEFIEGVEITGTTPADPDNTRTWIASYYPITDPESGEIVQAGVTVQDITARKRAERELLDRTRQLEAIAKNSPDFIVRFDRELRHLFVTRSLSEAIGVPIKDYLGKTNQELGMPQEAVDFWNRELRQVFETGAPNQIEFSFPDEAGEERFYNSIIVPETGEDATPETILAFTRDITERRRDERRLAASEARLATAIQASGGGVYEHRVPIGAELYHDERWAAILGYTRAELPTYDGFLPWIFARTHPDDRATLDEAYQAFIAGRTPSYDVTSRLRHEDGHWVWVRGFSRAVERDADGRVTRLVGLMLDISEIKASEAQRDFLIGELSHRVKNTLTVVQATTIKTLATGQIKPPDLIDKLIGRLAALGRSHDVLTQNAWQPVALADLIATALLPFTNEEDRRVTWRGPEVAIGARAVAAFTVALHELATNAVKHGALSGSAGRIDVTWTIADGEKVANGQAAGRALHLTWQERGGPPVDAPAHRGFGTQLLEGGIAYDLAGEATVDFAPDGLRWTAVLPLARIGPGPDEGGMTP